jgi:hypothetical protein
MKFIKLIQLNLQIGNFAPIEFNLRKVRLLNEVKVIR